MPSNTTYYNLWLFDASLDTGSTFLTFRSDIAGTAGTSNFMIIDAALHTHDTQITALQNNPGVVYVPLAFQSANYFTASGITGISSYKDGMIIDASLNQDCTGTVTININSLGTKSLVKYNSTGSGTINLSAGDMKNNKEYLFRYSLLLDVFLWINPTAGDQINVGGTSGNFVSLTATGTLQDSTIANSALVHLSGTETVTGAKTFNLPPNYATQSISGAATLASASAPIVLTDTTSAIFTLNLPSSPVTGEWFRIIDNTAKWATHNLTLSPNGKNIDGSSSNIVLSSVSSMFEVYYDGTQWHRMTSTIVSTTSYKGLLPALSGNATDSLRGDGTWTSGASPSLFDRLTQITGGASGTRTTLIITPSGETMNINVAGNLRIVSSNTSLDVNTSGNWIATTYATAANRAGKDFKIYAIENGGATAPTIQCDLAATAAPANSRLIGGFHCLCVAVGAIGGHTLTNYVAGDILPQSVWDLKWLPRRKPDGTYQVGLVRDPADGIWKGIYLVNTSYLSQYNTPKLVSVNWMDITDYLATVGMRLLRDREFQTAAAGSNEGTNITGSADTPNTGGHVDTAARRMISNIGCEDMCGLVWQWLDEQSYQYASTTSFGWVDQTGGKGQLSLQGATADVKLLAGGMWGLGAYCGSRSRSAGNVRWVATTNGGGRAGVEPG